ncbi:hypothetical protein L596_021713 [Steinernema carpocapsae]|uniref:Uncharacterized protein n=1 Tax=Steinernema carpocapsae TaxID=34508 RepID=A0A4U5MKE0_STECR|nr:hypothetical protein L596_021713 [Steinernema carpocapsae]
MAVQAMATQEVEAVEVDIRAVVEDTLEATSQVAAAITQAAVILEATLLEGTGLEDSILEEATGVKDMDKDMEPTQGHFLKRYVNKNAKFNCNFQSDY